MVAAIAFAHVWSVFQLTVLGALGRTIRMRTVFLAMAVGLFACAPAALIAQLAWTRAATFLTGANKSGFVTVAGYTADPFIEEIVKVLPMGALLMISTVRRQWSMTDCVLVAAAAGAGFGLAEDLYSYGAASHTASSIDKGWLLGTSISFPFVPNLRTTLTSWLPPGAAAFDIFLGETGQPWLNLHLAWSTIAGLAIGFVALRGFRAIWWSCLLMLYAGVSHAAYNAVLYNASIRPFLMRFTAVQDALKFLPILALIVAAFVDYIWRRAYPTSQIWTRLLRLTHLQDLGRKLRRVSSAILRRPTVIVSLVSTIPSLLWFIAGGFPQTAWLQKWMMERPAIFAVVAISIVAQVSLLVQLAINMRNWPRAKSSPTGEDAAVSALTITSGLGALGLGTVALLTMLRGSGPTEPLIRNYHVLERFADASSLAGLLLADASLLLLAGVALLTAASGVEVVGSDTSLKELLGNSRFVQGLIGFAVGVGAAQIPFIGPLILPGAVSAGMNSPTKTMEWWYGAGQVAAGIVQIVNGAGMIIGGGGAAIGGAVGSAFSGGASFAISAAGVTEVAAGAAVVGNGVLSAGAGLAVMNHANSRYDDETGDSENGLLEGTHRITNDPNADETLSPTHSEALRGALEEAKEWPSDTGYEAHHIVAWNARGAAPARAILEKAGIGIDSADNGVWLPRATSTSESGSIIDAYTDHGGVHTENYYEFVNEELAKVDPENKVAVRGVLNDLRAKLIADSWR